MKKASIIIFVMLLTSIGLKAQTEPVPRFTFGAEWGYIATFYSGYHFNFFAPEGYRADPRHQEFTYISNGEAYLLFQRFQHVKRRFEQCLDPPVRIDS